MQNKKITIIILIIAILILGGFTSLYIISKIQTKKTGTETTVKDFLPFGITSKIENSQIFNNKEKETNQSLEENESQAKEENLLKQLTTFAISGAVFFIDHRQEINSNPILNEDGITDGISDGGSDLPAGEDGSDTGEKITTPELSFVITPSIKYVQRSNGHIYQQYLDDNLEGKISNSTIPAIYEAIFSGDTKSLIFRYIASDRKTISSYLGTLGTDQGEFLSENISSIVVSPSGDKFFYLTPFSNGTNGTIRSFTDSTKNQIFTSSFSEWLPQWVNNETIYLTTKASSSVKGYIYSLNSSNGSFNKIFGGVYGLTTLGSPDGSMILYSSSSNNSAPELNIFNIQNRTNTKIGLYGLPEKCVWSKDSINIYCGIPNLIGTNQPDLWYQGIDSFDDSFVKINSLLGSYSNINTSFVGESLDAIKMFLDNKEETLFFINKKDYTLWSLNLN